MFVGSNPHRSFTHCRTYAACASGVWKITDGWISACSAGGSQGTTKVTSCAPRLERYAARSRGFTAVPVIQGKDAVVTIATLRPGSRRDFLCPTPSVDRPEEACAKSAERRRSSIVAIVDAAESKDSDGTRGAISIAFVSPVFPAGALLSPTSPDASDDIDDISLILSSIAAAAASASANSASVMDAARVSAGAPDFFPLDFFSSAAVSALSRAAAIHSRTAALPASCTLLRNSEGASARDFPSTL
mmetsp:Transcript_8317/g.34760  ORF Transcript_8317/g.34760 Transcript_8317/m.34760 type:complete len:246 (-) Transcript_8317:618-1355(-)